jgi:hypothetical protein
VAEHMDACVYRKTQTRCAQASKPQLMEFVLINPPNKSTKHSVKLIHRYLRIAFTFRSPFFLQARLYSSTPPNNIMRKNVRTTQKILQNFQFYFSLNPRAPSAAGAEVDPDYQVAWRRLGKHCSNSAGVKHYDFCYNSKWSSHSLKILPATSESLRPYLAMSWRIAFGSISALASSTVWPISQVRSAAGPPRCGIGLRADLDRFRLQIQA